MLVSDKLLRVCCIYVKTYGVNLILSTKVYRGPSELQLPPVKDCHKGLPTITYMTYVFVTE